jgi:hypothetical protein
MKKIIKEVDEKRGILQVTIADERWYIKEVQNPTTKLPQFLYVPAITALKPSAKRQPAKDRPVRPALTGGTPRSQNFCALWIEYRARTCEPRTMAYRIQGACNHCSAFTVGDHLGKIAEGAVSHLS